MLIAFASRDPYVRARRIGNVLLGMASMVSRAGCRFFLPLGPEARTLS